MFKKNLRKVYAENVEAKAFLKKHPEFSGFEMESTHDKPSNDAYYDRERESTIEAEKSSIIQEALNFYDKGVPGFDNQTLRLLLAYYDGASLNQLHQLIGGRRGATKVAIYRAKMRMYAWALQRPWEKQALGEAAPFGQKRLIYKGREKVVHLVQVATGETLWCAEDGAILPGDVQDALDDCEWDVLDLTLREEDS